MKIPDLTIPEIGSIMEQLALQFERASRPAEPAEDCWLIWCPDPLNDWYPFSPELAAKYGAQGCLVILVGEGEQWTEPKVLLPAGKTLASYPDPDHDAPPFGTQEIVWYSRAAEWSSSYREQWKRIADWLRSTCGHPMPEEYAESLSKIYGRWGGGYDLEAAEKARKEAVKVPEMAIPF